jgi:hypothetical protein
MISSKAGGFVNMWDIFLQFIEVKSTPAEKFSCGYIQDNHKVMFVTGFDDKLDIEHSHKSVY